MVIHLHTTDEHDVETGPSKIFSNPPVAVRLPHRRTAQNRTKLRIVTPSGIPHFELFISAQRKTAGSCHVLGIPARFGKAFLVLCRRSSFVNQRVFKMLRLGYFLFGKRTVKFSLP